MKVALKVARVCIENRESELATKVLERAAEYEDVLGQEAGRGEDEDDEVGSHLRVEYFGVRTILVSLAPRCRHICEFGN